MRIIGADDPDDPIVWERHAPDTIDRHGRLCFRSISLTQSVRDNLLAHFGQAWLDQYLACAERTLMAGTDNIH